METSLKLQLDVRNNAQELQNYMLDLNNWEEEMKRKEAALNNERPPESEILPPPRNKIKRSKLTDEKKFTEKQKKISAYDYSSWDKFDVEKACAEIDAENNDEKESDGDEEEQTNIQEESETKSEIVNKQFSLIDEAFYEKEMGNQFVKKEQWTDAIKCYTNAINLDSNNAIYYANRSLCFLKLKNFKSAETDATTSIQLDKKYVKAYQRRAFARQALGQLLEAKSDYEEILKLEPKNTLSQFEINKINEKLKSHEKIGSPIIKNTFNPKNIFKLQNPKPETTDSTETLKKQTSKLKAVDSTQNKNSPSTSKSDFNESVARCKTNSTSPVADKKNLNLKNEVENVKGGDGDKLVLSQSSKPKTELFQPLPEWCKIINPVDIPPHKRSKKPLRRIDIAVDKEDDVTALEKTKSQDEQKVKENIVTLVSYRNEDLWNERLSLDVPRTAIQFQTCWKMLKKNPEQCYSYLKKIPGKNLPQIFKDSLESDFFSELVNFLADDKINKEPEFMYNFLVGLTRVKRFSSLIMFMTDTDKKCIKECITKLEKVKPKEEVSDLLKSYELKI